MRLTYLTLFRFLGSRSIAFLDSQVYTWRRRAGQSEWDINWDKFLVGEQLRQAVGNAFDAVQVPDYTAAPVWPALSKRFLPVLLQVANNPVAKVPVRPLVWVARDFL